jgi:hypothetical protein
MSNLAKTIAVFGLLFFSVHIVSGYFFCKENFCPGDREADWVYEYTDDDGKRYIVIDDKPILKDIWQKSLGLDRLKFDEDKK